jgi:hypothetical protein
LGFSNWPVIYYKPTSFLAPSNIIKFSGIIITAPSMGYVDDAPLSPSPTLSVKREGKDIKDED